MSHRDEPRSGRGCFGAVVVVPFLALGGMFALIALTGGPSEAPLAAPPPSRPTSQWWTEPFETTASTVTETVVVEGQAREVRAARLATQTRVAVSTVTETVRSTVVKPPATGRNEPPGPPEEEPGETVLPSSSDTAAPPVMTSSSAVEPAPPVAGPPVTSGPAEPTAPVTETPVPSAPRAEDPAPSVPPVVPTTPVVPPPCDRSEPAPGGPGEPPSVEVPVELSVELLVGSSVASPAEVSSTSAAPLAGV